MVFYNYLRFLFSCVIKTRLTRLALRWFWCHPIVIFLALMIALKFKKSAQLLSVSELMLIFFFVVQRLYLVLQPAMHRKSFSVLLH